MNEDSNKERAENPFLKMVGGDGDGRAMVDPGWTLDGVPKIRL